MGIKKVGVVGCGRVPLGQGAGSAQVCAQSGYRTVVRETRCSYLEHGLARIESILSKDVSTGKLAEDAQAAALNNLHVATAADLAACGLIIEAIVENLDAKRARYQELDALGPVHTILASNTSSLTISEIAAVTRHPARCAGMRFLDSRAGGAAGREQTNAQANKGTHEPGVTLGAMPKGCPAHKELRTLYELRTYFARSRRCGCEHYA